MEVFIPERKFVPFFSSGVIWELRKTLNETHAVVRYLKRSCWSLMNSLCPKYFTFFNVSFWLISRLLPESDCTWELCEFVFLLGRWMCLSVKLLQGKKNKKQKNTTTKTLWYRCGNVNASVSMKMSICWNNLFFLGNCFNVCHVQNSFAVKSCISTRIFRQNNAFGKPFASWQVGFCLFSFLRWLSEEFICETIPGLITVVSIQTYL